MLSGHYCWHYGSIPGRWGTGVNIFAGINGAEGEPHVKKTDTGCNKPVSVFFSRIDGGGFRNGRFSMFQSVTVPLSELHPDPENCRIHNRQNIETIKSLYLRFGQYRDFIVRKSDYRIMIGNGLYLAMNELEVEAGSAVFFDLDEEQSRVLSILDNRAGDSSRFRQELLAVQLEGIPPELLAMTGFTPEEVTDLKSALAVSASEGYDRAPDAGPSDVVRLVFARYRIDLPRTQYDAWIGPLREHFRNIESLKAEIYRRLKLTEER